MNRKFRDVNYLYIHETLKNFAVSMIGIFIPIFIVSEGMPLSYAALFLVSAGLIRILFSYHVAKLSSLLGFKHGLAFSYLFLIPALVVIQLFDLSMSLILFSGLLYNLGESLHGISLKSEFALDSSESERDKDSGRMISFPSISRIIAPFLGGTIFAVIGFRELLTISVSVLIISIIPLFLKSDNKGVVDLKIGEVFDKKYLQVLPLFVIRGIQEIVGVAVYALFIFYLVGGTADAGGARALESLGFTITGLAAGYLAHKYGRNRLVLIGTMGAATLHILRGFITQPLEAFMLSTFAGIFFQLYHIPVYSKFADLAEKQENTMEFYTIRSIFVGVGKLASIIVLVTALYFTDLRGAFTATFVLAAITTVIMTREFNRLE